MKTQISNQLNKIIESLDVNEITTERKALLDAISAFLQSEIQEKARLNLNFICTHNSRRSHLAQIWAQTFASYFQLQNIICYSGGTEATTVYAKIIDTLKNQGFSIEKLADSNNPIYSIKYALNQLPITAFSKEIHHQFNPENNFIALMTCSSADADCPIVQGAKKRFSLPYNDPKLYDETEQQDEKYREKSLEIARELFYIFSKINA